MARGYKLVGVYTISYASICLPIFIILVRVVADNIVISYLGAIWLGDTN